MMLLFMPVVVIPLLLLGMTFFKGQQLEAEQEYLGINSNLPDVMLDQTALNKWKTYELEQLKERKEREAKRLDPYTKAITSEENLPVTLMLDGENELKAQEEQLQEKLQNIMELTQRQPSVALPPENDRQIIQAVQNPDPYLRSEQSYGLERASVNEEIDRLEYLMQRMQERHGQPDPELMQLEGLMDKVLALQYPDRYIPNLEKTREEVRSAFSVKQNSEDFNNGQFNGAEEERNGFYGLSSAVGMEVPIPESFPAVVGEDKQVVSGNSLMLKLTKPIEINGIQFGQGAEIHGVCQLDGERLRIQIAHIRHDNHLLPVKMEVYGMDALPGIAIPGAIGRDASKEGMAQGLQGYNPVQAGFTLQAQLAATGVETARGFLGKKTRLKKVNVKHGHPILLVDKA
ncbi:conjugative transposon protein TraM [Belliella sp. R4-6]|uniref:Conjugative transposon protein TraM n=1 Tax=Belliella alkalica TaxID=1730871 RepID=A0ABS9VFR0_9BACT|nr:conjugative transposon protein TraM [Belliella alkalica]MCH7415272.1 conjugative transposon protein TraM [Belliella alkalica]